MYPIIDKAETGKRIRRIMKEQNISARQVQEYLALSCVQSIYHWLDGRSLPTVDNLYALSELFQIPIDEMLCGNRKMKRHLPGRVNLRRLKVYYCRLTDCLSDLQAGG